jgi:hypothetical protein
VPGGGGEAALHSSILKWASGWCAQVDIFTAGVGVGVGVGGHRGRESLRGNAQYKDHRRAKYLHLRAPFYVNMGADATLSNQDACVAPIELGTIYSSTQYD